MLEKSSNWCVLPSSRLLCCGAASRTVVFYLTCWVQLLEVALGMQYLHSRGVIHGDLKGLNILVDEHRRPRIMDFGFSVVRTLTTISRTAAPPTAGTLRWMAPERLLHGKQTEAGDVYSFAMVVFEVLSDGGIPFQHLPDSSVTDIVGVKKLRPERPEDCPQNVWGLVERCWNDDPSKRPSFASLSVDLGSMIHRNHITELILDGGLGTHFDLRACFYLGRLAEGVTQVTASQELEV